MADRENVLLERGFVLHQRPYRNTSQLIECVTANHGRVGLVARGSRGDRGSRRALLQPFVPLRLSWTRRGELGTLTDVEPDGAPAALTGEALLAAYYANELVLRLVPRGDPNEAVFSCYSDCLSNLAASSVPRALRLFELRFLRALGYGLELEHEIETGEPLRPDGRYLYDLEHGPKSVEDRVDGEHVYSGRALLALGRETLDDEESLRAARRLLGGILTGHLGGRPLKSREVLKDIVVKVGVRAL